MNSKIFVDENDVLHFIDNGTNELTASDLTDLITQHLYFIDKYTRLMNYYKGHHDILNVAKKSRGKPDARAIVNFPAEIVTNSVGYFVGTPVKFDYEFDDDMNVDQKITNWTNLVNMQDKIVELAKQVDIFGRAYLLLYQDENKQTCVANVDPRLGFIVYDDAIEPKPLFGVYYSADGNQGYRGTLYSKTEIQSFTMNNLDTVVKFGEKSDNQFAEVPLVEAMATFERQGVYENVLSLIDAVDFAMSAEQNDIDYFSNTIMKVINAKIDQETINNMIDNRLINVKVVDEKAPVDIEFLNKPDANGIQERFIDRAVNFIYTKSMVANFNDEVFGNASGTSLEFKLQAMSNNANMKARKFTSVLKNVFRLAFKIGASLPLIDGGENNVKIKFTKTVPHNLVDEANTLQTLMNSGVVSEKTALSVLSVVDDPDKEIQMIQQERDLQSIQPDAYNIDAIKNKDAGEDK